MGRAPVFIYGFDDLTEAQLALVLTMAERSSVALAVNYADREALAARARLLSRLREEGVDAEHRLKRIDPATRPSKPRPYLVRSCSRPHPARSRPTTGFASSRQVGERGEAEAVGIEIARLTASGADPGEIVVVLRNPSADGPLFASVFRGLGIPATLEAQLPLTGTAVGRSLWALCARGRRSRRARGPPGPPAIRHGLPPGQGGLGRASAGPRRDRDD